MDRRDDEASNTDYEQLRRHVQRRAPERPAGRQLPRTPARELEEEPSTRFSVMEWLVGVGQVVARKLRRPPGSAMARVHPRK